MKNSSVFILTRVFSAVFVCMIFFVVFASFFTLKVHILELHSQTLQKQITEDKEAVQNLKAEWNYLNNPDYLKMMAQRHAPDMVPIKGNDNIKILTVPMQLSE